ncbi:hypothetical protein ACET3Z_024717 [Daucus carota]
MSWGDLPIDLLSAIFRYLTNDVCYLPDLYQCVYVCSSWRHVAKELCQCSVVRTAPWLLIPREQPDRLVFDTGLYDSHNKTSIVFDDSSSSILSLGMPISSTDQKIIVYASHGGWLLLGPVFKWLPSESSESEHPLFLYNPLLRVVIKLPPLPSHLRLYDNTQFVMSESSPGDPKCILCIKINWGVLAFCKPSTVLPSSWVLSVQPSSSKFYVVSMIFHKENFYTMDDDRALYVHPGITDFFLNGNGSGDMSRTWPWPVIENKVALSTYKYNAIKDGCFIQLVESKNGELLMVERIFGDEHNMRISFNVYRLTIRGSYKKKNWGSDKNNCYYYWKEVSTLEENEALYIGCNDSVSISVNVSDSNHLNTYKPNCIYFFDEYGDELCSYGVVNLENNSIDEFDPEDDAGPKFCRLFTPTIPGYY